MIKLEVNGNETTTQATGSRLDVSAECIIAAKGLIGAFARATGVPEKIADVFFLAALRSALEKEKKE